MGVPEDEHTQNPDILALMSAKISEYDNGNFSFSRANSTICPKAQAAEGDTNYPEQALTRRFEQVKICSLGWV